MESGQLDMWGGEGEGGVNWEISTDIYTRPCVKQLVGPAVYQRRLSSVLCDALGGWDEGRVGGSRGREYIYTYS